MRLQIAVRSLLSDAVHVGKAGGEPVASLSNWRRQFAFGSDRAASEKQQVRLVPEVGLIYLMPRWQGFLNVVLTIPCTAL